MMNDLIIALAKARQEKEAAQAAYKKRLSELMMDKQLGELQGTMLEAVGADFPYQRYLC